MDKILLTKVKDVLQKCTPETCDKVKTKLMVLLKPHEADEVYQYFIDIESSYIKETCKVQVYQVIPQYNDYFKNPNDITDMLLGLSYDNEIPE